MQSETLKPCPFCGSSYVRLRHHQANQMSWVSCVGCGLEAPSETGVTDADAVTYWNRRAEAALSTDAEPVKTAPAVAVKALDGGRALPYGRDTLGRFVREAWVRWAETQPEPKTSWLLPYDDLSEADKEADRQIGEAISRWTLVGDAARYAKVKEHLDNIEVTADAISSPYRNSIIRKNALSALSALSAQVQDVAVPALKIGIYGKAYDRPDERRAYTYDEQPHNVEAYKLGRVCSEIHSGGDWIDRGLNLLKALQLEGFGVFELPSSPASKHGDAE